ncbi:ApbE family lipoprotein [Alkaliphilus metalliredigens QYMF]|uniref:FAD:protein FMN transferase n=1 Tax=Alkaliphilus metalliredigens (strain QYMF) TaxID=293826 RepID=A6TMM3_ALKMQ|nr:FAD:protein FMN transferase [Alkaliphilus metalliredigens]ABR47441.1 ApbE family lipoprotein [Alkaliphilus metalliredigens QYMF]
MNTLKRKGKLILLLITLSILLMACGSEEPELVQNGQLALGTYSQISVYAPTTSKGEKAIEAAFTQVTTIENTLSTSIENSDVSQINLNAGTAPVQVDEMTLDVIHAGLDYYSITKGTFNIGLGSLIELWGIGQDWQKVPTDEEIQEAKQHIDLSNIEISEKEVFITDPHMLMDLGGIAKGYAVDEAVGILRSNGIESGFVNFGGDVYALGNKSDGTPWRIGIQNPEIGESGVIARMGLTDKAIVTSGDYERYFVENDVRYHHIIDPETGYPSTNEISSVTIISDKSMDADVLSTAIFILGLEKGLDLIESLEEIQGVIVTKDRSVYISSGIKNEVEMLDSNFSIVN